MINTSWKILLLCFSLLPQLTKQTGERCVLSDEAIVDVREFKLPRENCSHVVGNILLIHTESNEVSNDALASIEEVTGFVQLLAYSSKPTRISFPNLKVIRGEHLYRVNLDDPEYSLLVVNRGGSNFSIEFPALRRVLRGSVGIYSNGRMCFLESINWKEIISDEDAQFHYFPSFDNKIRTFSAGAGGVNESEEECGKCHPNCVGGCWGEGEENCQQVNKFNCSSHCNGALCFGVGQHECCHSSCAIGCTGPTAKECDTCKHVEYQGECRAFCPSEKYTFGVDCVDSCMDGSLLDEEEKACLPVCSENKWKEGNKCVKIPSDIRKCRRHTLGTDINPVTISRIQNCNVIEGTLSISQGDTTFRHWHNLTHVIPIHQITKTELAVLNNIRIVTGNVQIIHWNSTQPPAFKNLEEIGGSLQIINSKLESLDFPSLRRIHGNVLIANNLNLCYDFTINWSALRLGNGRMNVGGNKDGDDCNRDGLVCSDNCSDKGCWGSGSEKCVCLEYRQEGRCVPICDSGYLKDGHQCVKACAEGKHEQNGECVYCHESCKEGCTGPGNVVGAGGCNSCFQALIENEKYTCMEAAEGCPPDYYGVTPDEFDKNSGVATDYACARKDSGGMTNLLVLGAGALIIILIVTFGFVLYCRGQSANPAETESVRYTTLNLTAEADVEIM